MFLFDAVVSPARFAQRCTWLHESCQIATEYLAATLAWHRVPRLMRDTGNVAPIFFCKAFHQMGDCDRCWVGRW